MKKKKIAILGATGHIAKSLINIFCEKDNYELFLFSRTPTKVEEFLKEYNKIHHVFHLVWFDAYDYDVVINCIGIGDPTEIKNGGIRIFEITEKYDNEVIEYLKTHPDTLYINLSSGAVYGNDFEMSVNESTYSVLNINNLAIGDFYSIAKLNSEAKHRALKDFNIVDLRVFGYFSRFIDLNYQYFMNDIIKSVRNNTVIETSLDNIYRDYVNPNDLFALVEICTDRERINDVFDVYSLRPVSKFEILEYFSKDYGLEYTVTNNNFLSVTGKKSNYYSDNKKAEKIGYMPKYMSIDTIKEETGYLL